MKITPRLRSTLHGTAKAALPALLGAGILAYAVPGTAGAAPATYSAQAKSAGLVLNVFGTELTGGSASVSVDSGQPSAAAEGTGVLTPGMVEDQKASADSSNPSQSDPYACAQGGGLPAGAPLGVTLGLACSSATASVSSGAPDASATGQIAGLDVNASGILNQIISSGGNQLFSGIQQVLGQLNGTPLGTGSTACPDPHTPASSGSTSSAASGNPAPATGSSASATSGAQGSTGSSSASGSNPLSALVATASVPGTPLNGLLGSLALSSTPAASSPGPLGNLLQGLCQTLTNIENVVKGSNPPSTLVVKIGPASASIDSTKSSDATKPDTSVATAKGATAEIEVLPGVGCDASSLASCITAPSSYAVPLIDIKIAPAQATDTWDGTNWKPSTTASLASIALNIPGDAQTISVGPGQSLDLLSGTPLETVIDLGSATASGWSGTANGATLDLVKGVNGGILVDLGSSRITGGDSPATAAVAATPVKQQPAAPSTPALAPPASGPSPTLVHTGAWWSGSMPYLGGLAALGGGLLGWPRLRRGSKGLGALLRSARR
jgi:hypothetical protein